ncbi:MAG: amidohydrolase family protein [Clostridia bacterium]|nr:amidohydrolase family protein [Clostridia bacterium]
MRIIDFHTHIFPEKIAGKATEFISNFYDIGTDYVGSSSMLLEKGRKAGITDFVVLPVVMKAEQTHRINEFILEECALHKEFFGFGTLHIDTPDLEKEMEYISENDFKGLKFHPDMQKFAIDDPKMMEIYDYMQGKLPILFHCGDPRYDYSHPSKVKRILKDFPKLTVIAAHLGGWSMYDTAEDYLKDTDCYFDISSSLAYMSPEKAAEHVRRYGSERVLFGTDFPLWDYPIEMERFEKLPLSDDEKENIYFKNALRLLNG